MSELSKENSKIDKELSKTMRSYLSEPNTSADDINVIIQSINKQEPSVSHSFSTLPPSHPPTNAFTITTNSYDQLNNQINLLKQELKQKNKLIASQQKNLSQNIETIKNLSNDLQSKTSQIVNLTQATSV